MTSCHAQSLTNPNCLHVLCLLAQDKFHFNMPELLANTSVLEDSARCCGETCLPGDILHVLPYYIYIHNIICFVWRRVCSFAIKNNVFFHVLALAEYVSPEGGSLISCSSTERFTVSRRSASLTLMHFL